MPKIALISDIHSNIEALTAVMDDIEARGCEKIYCLGDIVGYGPNPVECIDIIRQKCQVVLQGNHDEAVVIVAYAFNRIAKQAVDWTREVLKPNETDSFIRIRRWNFLKKLPQTYEEEGMLLVHGSPRNPTQEYITVHDIAGGKGRKFEEYFSKFDKILFCGHSHLPCVIREDLKFLIPTDEKYRYRYNGKKVIVNVGSVGQPRDGDARACWVEYDSEREIIAFRRVEYDVNKTIQKIFSNPNLNNSLGSRLKTGN